MRHHQLHRYKLSKKLNTLVRFTAANVTSLSAWRVVVVALIPSLAVNRIGPVAIELEACRTCRLMAFSSTLGWRAANVRR